MKAQVECLSEHVQQEQDMIVPFTPNILTPSLIAFKCLFILSCLSRTHLMCLCLKSFCVKKEKCEYFISS